MNEIDDAVLMRRAEAEARRQNTWLAVFVRWLAAALFHPLHPVALAAIRAADRVLWLRPYVYAAGTRKNSRAPEWALAAVDTAKTAMRRGYRNCGCRTCRERLRGAQS